MSQPIPPRGAFLIGLLSLALPVSGLAQTQASLPAEAAKWENLTDKKSREFSPEPGAVLCIGSSHMALWKTVRNDLAPLNVYNLGIGGSKMKHAADLFVPRLVIPFRPRAVLLYEGSNDIAGGASAQEVLAQFQRLSETLHEALPNTRLYVLGIVPSPGKRFEKWEAIQQANALLKAECEAHDWMRFLDTTTPLLDANGKPRTECFIPNDVHMTLLGYETWASVVVPAVVPAEAVFESAPKP